MWGSLVFLKSTLRPYLTSKSPQKTSFSRLLSNPATFVMNFSLAVLAATVSGAGAFTAVGNLRHPSATQLNERQPIMAGNWKVNPMVPRFVSRGRGQRACV